MINQLVSLKTPIYEQYDNMKICSKLVLDLDKDMDIPSGCLSLDYIYKFGEIDNVPLMRLENDNEDNYVFLAYFYINKNEFPYFNEQNDNDQFVCNYHFHFNRDYISDDYDFGDDVSDRDISLFITEFERLQSSEAYSYTNSQTIDDYQGEININSNLEEYNEPIKIYYNCMNYDNLAPTHNVKHIASFQAEPGLLFNISNINYQINYENLVSEEQQTIKHHSNKVYTNLNAFKLDLDFNTLYNYKTGDFIIKDDGIDGFYSPWKTKIDYLISFELSCKGTLRTIIIKHNINYTSDLWGENGLYKFYSNSKNFDQIELFKEI